MCGIVGLLVKKPSLRHQLGALMVPMLTGMTERGPDSAGLAVYTTPVPPGRRKLSLYSGEHAVDWSELLGRVRLAFAEAHEIATHGNQAVLTTAADADHVVIWLKRNAPGIAVLSVPDNAVIDSGDRQVVIVDKGEGRFEPRAVALGRRGAGYVEIRDGVTEGEAVVTSANFLIDAESNLKAALNGLDAGEKSQ